MSQGTLYYLPASPRSNWFSEYLKELKLDVESVSIKESSTFATDFPLKKAPAFKDPTGLKLNETIAIAQYLADLAKSPLAGSSPLERAQITRWTSFVNGDSRTPVLLLWFKPESTQAEKDAANLKLKSYLQYLDDYLSDTKFIGGAGNYTWGDIFVSYNVKHFLKFLDGEYDFKNIDRWFKDVEEVSPSVRNLKK